MTPAQRRLAGKRRVGTVTLISTAAVLAVMMWQQSTTPRDVATQANAAMMQPHVRGAPAPATAQTPAAAAVVARPAGPSRLHVVEQEISFRDDTARHGPGPQLRVDAGILVDLDRGSILWQKNPHLAHPPASTAKVLSSLIALENFPPERAVTITQDALTQQPDETIMGLKAGQTLTVRELLTGMLTVSANDGATALAADTVGMTDFVAAMNAQVRALGLHDSSFTTPVGLDDPGQLASPYDLAAIASVDYDRFPLFRELVGMKEVDLPTTSGHPAFVLRNLNQLLDMYPNAAGIKPGYTGNAGACLIGLAKRDGHRLLSVLLGGMKVYTESTIVLDWGFTEEGLPPLLPPTPAPMAPKAPQPAPRPA